MPHQAPIVFLASGTRGDVQPYIALAQQLKRRGQRPLIVTHDSFQPLVESHGIEFALLQGNLTQLLTQDVTQSALVVKPNLVKTIRASLNFWQTAKPLYAQMLHSAWHASQNAKAVIIGLPTLWGYSIAQKLNVPCFAALLQPLSRTRVHPTVFQPYSFSFGAYNALTHRLTEQIMWQPWRTVINRWRHHLSLPPLHDLFTPLYQNQIPFLYGFSAHVVPRPPDWVAAHEITGYWFLDSTYQAPADLKTFIAQGTPPLFIGLGSMGYGHSRATLLLIQQALQLLGERAVVATSESLNPSANLFPIRDVPHHWLLPQMRLAVHHGGAGTTGASLRAGLPTLITPVAVDQLFWGERVAALGVGVKPLSRHTLTAQKLAHALSEMLNNASYAQRAQELSEKIKEEAGVAKVIEEIEHHLF